MLSSDVNNRTSMPKSDIETASIESHPPKQPSQRDPNQFIFAQPAHNSMTENKADTTNAMLDMLNSMMSLLRSLIPAHTPPPAPAETPKPIESFRAANMTAPNEAQEIAVPVPKLDDNGEDIPDFIGNQITDQDRTIRGFGIGGFQSSNPGDFNNDLFGAGGKYFQNVEVDDSFLTTSEQRAIRSAIDKEILNPPEGTSAPRFFADNFNLTGGVDSNGEALEPGEQIYNFFVGLANVETAGGAQLYNPGDAIGGEGIPQDLLPERAGSAGMFHLHNFFGYQDQAWGETLNTFRDPNTGELVTPRNVTPEQYARLAIRSIDANYEQSLATEQPNADSISQELGITNQQLAFLEAIGIWWVGGENNQEAGEFYLQAVSNFVGVNNDTGSNLTLSAQEDASRRGPNEG